MIRPIPRNLLPDEMQVREPADGDYGGEYAEAYTVNHVRFDAANPLLRTPYVLQDGSKGIVFLDAVNSDGWRKEIPAGSLLSIRGEDMQAVNVRRFESFGGLVHHWEIEVR